MPWPSSRRLSCRCRWNFAVAHPVALRPRRGAPQPRLGEISDGCILNTGDQNPGVRRVIQQHASAWRRLGVPVIVHLAADTPPREERAGSPQAVARTARALATTGAVAGLEVGLPNDVFPAQAADLVAAACESELPVLARVPL